MTSDLGLLFAILDQAGTFVFALTGALVAARTKNDIITFLFFAGITGVGGGTIRDLLINAPVFWISQPYYMINCAIAALFVWLFAGFIEKQKFDLVIWLDAIGLAAFSVIGAHKALLFGVSPINAIIMGVITCVFGGVIRDVFAGQPNMLLRREIYISAALLGAGSFIVLMGFEIGFWLSAIIAFTLAFTLRALAIVYGLTLPGFRKRVG